jgi:hypothetical protein
VVCFIFLVLGFDAFSPAGHRAPAAPDAGVQGQWHAARGRDARSAGRRQSRPQGRHTAGQGWRATCGARHGEAKRRPARGGARRGVCGEEDEAQEKMKNVCQMQASGIFSESAMT